MSQAILAFNDRNFITCHLSHKQRVYLHWVLQIIAGVAITIGFTTLTIHKIENGNNEITPHGGFGIVSYTLTLFSFISGLPAKYSLQMRKTIRPVLSKVLHGISGLLAYLLAIVAISIGIHHEYFEADLDFSTTLLMIIIVTAAYVAWKPLVLTMERIKTMIKK